MTRGKPGEGKGLTRMEWACIGVTGVVTLGILAMVARPSPGPARANEPSLEVDSALAPAPDLAGDPFADDLDLVEADDGEDELATAGAPPAADVVPGEAALRERAALCGSVELQREMTSLVDVCRGQQGVCDQTGRYSNAHAVDVTRIYGATRERIPFTMAFFGTGRGRLGRRDVRRVRDFVDGEVAKGRPITLFVFGSSSPTGALTTDTELGRKRTEGVYTVVFRHAYREGHGTLLSFQRTNIGRDRLEADFCELLPAGAGERTRCERLDPNRRRQAAYVLAYPTECLQPPATAGETVAHAGEGETR